ncbi:exodeoxyribonuclease VII large subunit [Mariniblastus sp.]|nr:exodeoxyribonuclease VII large subunit [Mariniblastus sp.]
MTKPVKQPTFHSLSAITGRIEAILKPATEKTFWVRAEISGGRSKNEHFYCNLVEINSSGHQVANIRCTIWRTQLNAIRAKFKKAGLELELENGTLVGLNCNLTYSKVYGLAINVLDADPAFALGILELRRRELLQKLEKEKLFEPNKKVPVPLLPQRIGLITSDQSAASSDFLKTIKSSNHGFTILLADSTMQGEKTENSICRSFDRLVCLKPDLIVIVRGGGSKTDLSHLDNEAIARRIAKSNIPVWTGIGHEIDESVLDFVANQQFKTPTAVAVAIVERFDKIKVKTIEAAQRIQSTWSFRVSNWLDSLARWKNGLRQGTRKMLQLTKADFRTQASQLKLLVANRVSTSREHLLQAKPKLVSTAENVIGRCVQNQVDSKLRIATLVDKRLSAEKSSVEFYGSRFRVERYLDLVSQRSQLLELSRLKLSKKTTQLLESQKRELKRYRSAFTEARYGSRLERERESLKSKQRLVRAADPVNNLQRGYSLVYDDENNLVTSASKVNPSDELVIFMSDGKVKTSVDEVEINE